MLLGGTELFFGPSFLDLLSDSTLIGCRFLKIIQFEDKAFIRLGFISCLAVVTQSSLNYCDGESERCLSL